MKPELNTSQLLTPLIMITVPLLGSPAAQINGVRKIKAKRQKLDILMMIQYFISECVRSKLEDDTPCKAF